jgi:hypothetical protein
MPWRTSSVTRPNKPTAGRTRWREFMDAWARHCEGETEGKVLAFRQMRWQTDLTETLIVSRRNWRLAAGAVVSLARRAQRPQATRAAQARVSVSGRPEGSPRAA